jgi:hypothetical protein
VLYYAYIKEHIGKHLSDTFTIQNGLKQGDALLTPLLSFAIEYAITRAQENMMGLKLNATHQLLFHSILFYSMMMMTRMMYIYLGR